MRNLAFRFVTQPKSPRPTDVAIHVVDPHLNLMAQFQNIESFQNEMRQRKQPKINVAKVADEYNQWWHSYQAFENMNSDNHQGKREAKSVLFSRENALIDALKLPNRLTLEPSFLDADYESFDAIKPISKVKSVLQTAETLESQLFDAFPMIRLDPPRMVRPAITEAFNASSKNVIRFHEGQNPAMHLVGVTPPGLLVSFVASRFTSTNTFPLSFLARGVGYSRALHHWQRHFVAGVLLAPDSRVLFSHLNALRTGIEQAVSNYGPTITKITEPKDLHPYEATAAITSINTIPIARFSHTGTYLAERLQIQTDPPKNDKNPKFLNCAFFEIDVSTLIEKLT